MYFNYTQVNSLLISSRLKFTGFHLRKVLKSMHRFHYAAPSVRRSHKVPIKHAKACVCNMMKCDKASRCVNTF